MCVVCVCHQVQRRRLVTWMNVCRQGTLDEVMQTSLQISSSLTGSMKASASFLDDHNRWSRIQGDRSCGRWAVGSTRTTTVESVSTKSGLGGGFRSSTSSDDMNISVASGSLVIPPPRRLQRQQVSMKYSSISVIIIEVVNYC